MKDKNFTVEVKPDTFLISEGVARCLILTIKSNSNANPSGSAPMTREELADVAKAIITYLQY